MSAHFSHLSFLDCLTPDPGWKTDCAVISTYSAQIPVLAAALLALAGEGDEAGSGSRVGMVRAITGLRGKAHVVLQSGRLTQGRSTTTIAALFDQFLVQIPWGESAGFSGKSWHAKFFLVRQLPVDPEMQDERWVFMVGSRNLTLDSSWDIGISLKGGAGWGPLRGEATQVIPGIAQIATHLAGQSTSLSHWSHQVRKLQTMQWRVPEGIFVEALRLMLPDDPPRTLPQPPSSIRRLVAVSPFLDKGAVAALRRWPRGDDKTRFQLLSTRPAMAGVLDEGGRLDGYDDLLVLAVPELEIPDRNTNGTGAPTDSDSAPPSEETLELENVGLHAKLIYVEHAVGCTMWLGSANLTQRAWTRNAECVIRIDSTMRGGVEQLRAGLDALLNLAEGIDPTTLAALGLEKTPEERLERARNEVAAKLGGASQEPGLQGHKVIRCDADPNPEDPEIQFHCGRLIGTPSIWPRGKLTHSLPTGIGTVESECISCRLTLKDLQLAWVQIIQHSPPLDVDQRDSSVLGEYLGPKQMLSWIHSELTGYTDGEEGGPWDLPRTTNRNRQTSSPGIELPTLEQALRLWLIPARRSGLDEVDRILKLRPPATSGSEQDLARVRLDRFAATWRVIRATLGSTSS